MREDKHYWCQDFFAEEKRENREKRLKLLKVAIMNTIMLIGYYSQTSVIQTPLSKL